MKRVLEIALQYNATRLNIPCPNVEIVDGFPGTETMLSAIDNTGELISVRRDALDDPLNTWLAISHEMRHVWQLRHNAIPGAVLRSGEVSTDVYNCQPHEVDAQAWAIIVMHDVFGIRPKWENKFSRSTIEAINVRVNEIRREEFLK